MVDIDKAMSIGWNPITKSSGHPFAIIGNIRFNATVDSFKRGSDELDSAKPSLVALFPDLDQSEVYSIFCNSVHIARQELAQS